MNIDNVAAVPVTAVPDVAPIAVSDASASSASASATSVSAPVPSFAAAVEAPAFTSADELTVTCRERALYLIDDAGVITRILTPADPDYTPVRAEAARLGRLIAAADGQYLLPGFTDLHVHAPQWAQAGAALDEPLERWLGRYTFPTEARFADPAWADRLHRHLVDALLARGTTSVLYYDTIDRTSAVNLAQVCAEKGQRAFVGKVVMDDPDANPEYYRETTDQALAETEAFIGQVRELANAGESVRRADPSADPVPAFADTAPALDLSPVPPLVQPVITPRFIPSCTDRALAGLGELAARYGCFTQTHCSESDWEHRTVRERTGRSDTQALDDFGLLTSRTVMQHCVYLSDADADLFARRGAAVAHCPLSNAYFASAVAPVRRYRSHGVTVGLGTDISGGYDPSVMMMVRLAAIASRMLASGTDARLAPAERGGVPDALVTLDQAFWFATAGGAQALGVKAGRLEPGYAWDAQLIDVHAPASDLPVFEADEDPKVVFQKIMHLSTPANVTAVWVQGRRVGRTGPVRPLIHLRGEGGG